MGMQVPLKVEIVRPIDRLGGEDKFIIMSRC